MNEKLSLQDLVALLAQKADITQKEADRFYRELFQLVLERIYENDIVKIKDFGVFKLVHVSARESVDVNTGVKIEIPAHKKMTFNPDRSLKEMVNQPFAHFESVVLDDGTVVEESSEPDTDTDVAQVDVYDNRDEQEDTLSDNEAEEKTEESVSPETTENPAIPEIIDEDKVEELKEDQEAGFEIDENEEPDAMVEAELLLEEEEEVRLNLNIHQVYEEEEKGEDETEPIEAEPVEKDNLVDEAEPDSPSVDEDQEDKPEVETGKPKRLLIPLDDRIILNREKSVSAKMVEGRVENEPVVENRPSENKDIEDNHVEKVIEPPIVPPSTDVFEESEDNTDFEYENSYLNYEKQTFWSKIRGKLPIILLAVAVLIFVVYQYAKLFDVTYDYESQIGRHRNFSLTDTLPMMGETQPEVLPIDTTPVKTVPSTAHKEPEDIVRTENRITEVLTTPDTKTVEDKTEKPDVAADVKEVIVGAPAGFDGLAMGFDGSNVYRKKVYEISDSLKIRVQNKAQLYLENRKNKK